MRILFIEDDKELAKITKLNLKKHGFAVDTAFSGEQTISLLEGNGEYDVIVLDLFLPDIDGTELLKEIKLMAPYIPVLALTARDAEEDRVNGLKIGFDDYMTKPFSHHELAARLRVLYRSRRHQAEKIIKVGPLQIYPQNQTAFIKGVPIKLTTNEFRLLHYLAKHRGKVVSMEELLASVWDRNSSTGNAKVFTTISRLRNKIGDHRKKIIITCKDGYKVA